VQEVIQAAKAGDWALTPGATGEEPTVVVGDVTLEPGEFELELEAADTATAIGFLSGEGFVILDTATTPELEAEGLARDVIRAIQDTRKAADLDVSDRIELVVTGSDPGDIEALTAFGESIAAETLALSWRFVLAPNPAVAAATGSDAGQRATVAAGQYANSGSLVIDVVLSGAVNV
jgi:isoleucyl-tRNA synthetase